MDSASPSCPALAGDLREGDSFTREDWAKIRLMPRGYPAVVQDVTVREDGAVIVTHSFGQSWMDDDEVVNLF